MLNRRVVPLTRDNLDDLPAPCRTCAFWELDPVTGERARAAGESAGRKAAWLSSTLLDWGSCGRIAYVGETPAAYVLFAPPAYVPRSDAFATSPVGADAVLLATLHVLPEFTGRGLGRVLVQTVAADLVRRRVHAIEAFGSPARHPSPCLVPADFLLAVGFKTVRPHPRHPRLRLDLRSTVTWREDVEGALERLLGALTHPEGAFRPV